MHSYLRAIGFSQYKSRKQLEKIYYSTLRSPNRKIVTTISIDTSLIQIEKDFGAGIGLALVGEYDINGALSIEHYYPYLKGEVFSEYEGISIEKQTDKESYAGVCDDYRLGMTLIFYLLNIADYAKSKWLNYSNRHLKDVKLSGLSIGGTILLGVQRDKNQKWVDAQQRDLRNRLLAAAKNGDTDAIENLTLEEMDIYTSVSGRIHREDILSIVDTSFMPCGVECDHYMILGNILKVEKITNEFTDEKVYKLLVEANDIVISIGINEIDLQGEPKEGRRFRGEVWLQGYVRI
ncbi:MAG: DUF3881 family protein [Clostridium sp.]|nr:DUF3881 family protein [Clostridium sp.]MCM1460083.1 DUF3881 family protein [Bacteroides sp.]